MILLDTNAAIAVMKDRPRAVRRSYQDALFQGERVLLSSIVLFELRYGVARSGYGRENAERLRRFVNGQLALLAVDDQDAVIAAELRAALEARGTPIGPYDLLIAAQALRHDATLVTANTREFSCVPGLKVEDWAG
jgi:tRNA(fMet)-specific endonuclease VapC